MEGGGKRQTVERTAADGAAHLNTLRFPPLHVPPHMSIRCLRAMRGLMVLITRHRSPPTLTSKRGRQTE